MTPRDPFRAAVPDRIRVEWSGDELRVLDPQRAVVHRLCATDVRAIAEGRVDPYVPHLPSDVLEAVVRALHDQRWDRRRVLAGSTALAAAGITTVLLPAAAVAGSIGGLVYGTGYDEEVTYQPDTVGVTALSMFATPRQKHFDGYVNFTVPNDVSRVQIVAWATNGGFAGAGGSGVAPSPYSGTPGVGARAVGTFTVTGGSRLVVVFGNSQRLDLRGGGVGGSAVAVGDVSASPTRWLIVAGGGGGGGQAGVDTDFTTPQYISTANGGFAGGAGGDAGIGAAAGDGTAGSGEGALWWLDKDPSLGGTAVGGSGATTSAVGSGGPSTTIDRTGFDDTSTIAGAAGSAPKGPAFTSSFSTTGLGIGGQTQNNNVGGGNGGSGLYGGGSGAGTARGGASGGGGGGSSYLDTDRRAAFTQSEIALVSRPVENGPTVTIYY